MIITFIHTQNIDGKDAEDLDALAEFCESQAEWCAATAENALQVIKEMKTNNLHSSKPDGAEVVKPEVVRQTPVITDVKPPNEAEELVERFWKQAESSNETEQILLKIAYGGGKPAQQLVSALLNKLQEAKSTLNATQQSQSGSNVLQSEPCEQQTQIQQ